MSPTLQPPRAYFEVLASVGVLPDEESGSSPPVSREKPRCKVRSHNYPRLPFESASEYGEALRAIEHEVQAPIPEPAWKLDKEATRLTGIPVIQWQRGADGAPVDAIGDSVIPDVDRADPVDTADEVAEFLKEDPAFVKLTESERKLLVLLLDGRSLTGEFHTRVALALGINHAAARKQWSRLRKKILPAVSEARSDWEAISAIRRLATV